MAPLVDRLSVQLVSATYRDERICATFVTIMHVARFRNWQDPFIAELADCGNISAACKAAGVQRTTAYRTRDKDPIFARRWDDAINKALDSLEQEAWRRAREGVTRIEPIMYQGEQVAEKIITEYSDNLITFLLKANRPGKYREQIKITIGDANRLIDDAITRHELPAPTSDALDSSM